MSLSKEEVNVEKNLAAYARRFFSGTLLSRISGMGRDLSMAFAFGDHPSVAAFMVAFRLSNLFRRLLGEGPLQSAFIPHFEGLRSQNSTQATFFFRKLVSLLTVIILGIIFFSEIGVAAVLHFGNLSESNREIVELTGWLFPGLLFICLYGLNISLLNCYNSFFIPSVAPFICNLIWIGSALWLRHENPSFAMSALTKWVVIGFVAQWLLTLPLTLKYARATLKDWLTIEIPPEVKKLIKTFSLGAIGVGAMQINSLADAFFARYADIRGPTYLWYSIRLEQLAFAVFGVACVMTIAPRLSRAIKECNQETAQKLFSLSYKRIMTIMIPCTFAIIALGLSAVNLIYGRGSFSEIAVLKTNICLLAYGLGLIPSTLILLFSTVFYAIDEFRIPTFISILSVIVNLVLNYFFVFVMDFGVVSTALATSLSAWLNFWILFKLASKKDWQIQYSFKRTLGMIFVSTAAVLCTMATAHYAFDMNLFDWSLDNPTHLSTGLFAQLINFSSLFLAFCGSFFGFGFLFKNEDVLELFQKNVNAALVQN